MNYWLLKSEPGDYSIDDLRRDGRTAWSGIRNYQARNYLRDSLAIGDMAIIYHSNAEPPAAVGIGRVSGPPIADETAFDAADSHYDPVSTPDNPRWWAPEIEFVGKFRQAVGLDEIKDDPDLAGVLVAKKGMRLSVQPLSKEHFERLVELGNGK